MILTRKEFKKYFDSLDPRVTGRGGPLWIPETFDNQKICCRWFVKIRPIELEGENTLKSYWDWCRSTMTGELRCFSCSAEDQEEWWGFTHKRDIAWWLMKWTK